MMLKTKILAIILVIVAIGILMPKNPGELSEYDARISFLGNVDGVTKPGAKFEMANRGTKSIQVPAYCTVHYTNIIGKEISDLHYHATKDQSLKPGEKLLIEVPTPPALTSWNFGISYRPRENRAIVLTRRFAPNLFAPDNKFYVIWSPNILLTGLTNGNQRTNLQAPTPPLTISNFHIKPLPKKR